MRKYNSSFWYSDEELTLSFHPTPEVSKLIWQKWYIRSENSSVNILFFLLTFSNTLGGEETHNVRVRWRKHVTSIRKEKKIVGVVYPKMMIFFSFLSVCIQFYNTLELFFFLRFQFFFMFEQIFVSQWRNILHTHKYPHHDCLIFISGENEEKKSWWAFIRSINFEHFHFPSPDAVQECGNEKKNMNTNVENVKCENHNQMITIALGLVAWKWLENAVSVNCENSMLRSNLVMS